MSPRVCLCWAEPAASDPAYVGTRDLRYRVLRRPLGMLPGTELNASETACWHLAALSGETVVGCVIFRDDGDGAGQLMQMAVDPDQQGHGVGRALIEALEERAKLDGIERIYLHAREVAVGFYASLGYAVEGEPYLEVGIPHRHMAKQLGTG